MEPKNHLHLKSFFFFFWGGGGVPAVNFPMVYPIESMRLVHLPIFGVLKFRGWFGAHHASSAPFKEYVPLWGKRGSLAVYVP